MCDRVLVDVRYALRQLREFRDVQRAIDALERVEEALAEPGCMGCGAAMPGEAITELLCQECRAE